MDHGGGRPGVRVRRIEVAGLTICHPLVPSDGGIQVPQLCVERLDLSLSSQQMSAQLHHHILVVYHLHPGNILLHPGGLKLVLLLLRQEAPRNDGLPGGVNHSIIDRCSEGWPLVPAEDPGPREDLCDDFEFHPPWTRGSIHPESRGGGDAQVSQQSIKPSGGDPSFSPEGLRLLGISLHLLALCVSQGRVLLVIFIFVVDVVVLLLLLLNRCALGC
jgi:hypothetical protein